MSNARQTKGHGVPLHHGHETRASVSNKRHIDDARDQMHENAGQNTEAVRGGQARVGNGCRWHSHHCNRRFEKPPTHQKEYASVISGFVVAFLTSSSTSCSTFFSSSASGVALEFFPPMSLRVSHPHTKVGSVFSGPKEGDTRKNLTRLPRTKKETGERLWFLFGFLGPCGTQRAGQQQLF